MAGDKTKENITGTKISFIERWGRVEESNSVLRFTLYAVIIFCGALLFFLFKMAMKPQPIYYIPGAQAAGVAYPNHIEKGSINGFAISWLLSRTNFTPVTVEDVYARATKYMAPGLLSKTRASLDEEIRRVIQDSISSLFSLSKDPEISETETGFKVGIAGEKVLYMGKEKIDTQRVVYTIFLDKTPPTEINPYGFVISGMKQAEIDDNTR
ncbi:MAG TPA: hypothetical protein DCL49_04540 [Candidatus Omnitrophica bacterium]|nr:hypothetical protein [Candidatus Omnitrophota bacterium]